MALAQHAKRLGFSLLFITMLSTLACYAGGSNETGKSSTPSGNPSLVPSEAKKLSVHDFIVYDIEGNTRSLSEFKGKTLLLVNTASNCGYTYQYEGLQVLYDSYRQQGFEILAFPSNDFMGQEPGSNEQIAEFCRNTFNTSFPLFAKIRVNGNDAHPLYRWLVGGAGGLVPAGPIGWNFTKFLVSPEGEVIGRWDSKVEPQAPELVAALQKALPKP